MANENETVADIVAWIRDLAQNYRNAPISKGITIEGLRVCDALEGIADRIEKAWKREIDEIVKAVSELKEGMCLHCDVQDYCIEGEDGMPTTCNAMANIRNFLQKYEKQEGSNKQEGCNDEYPF